MAHYKRKRSRTAYTKRGKMNTTYWLNTWPRWWDVLFHNRPRRRKDHKVCRDIVRGDQDHADAIWAVEKKPHKYYW